MLRGWTTYRDERTGENVRVEIHEERQVAFGMPGDHTASGVVPQNWYDGACEQARCLSHDGQRNTARHGWLRP